LRKGNARKAGNCFREDVVYPAAPRHQLYQGYSVLYEFSTAQARIFLQMTWRQLTFNQGQNGLGE
jgi:hypothetical protein